MNKNTSRTLDWAQLVRAAAGREQPYPAYQFKHPRFERPLQPGETYRSLKQS